MKTIFVKYRPSFDTDVRKTFFAEFAGSSSCRFVARPVVKASTSSPSGVLWKP
jgi:hypothetical protein